MRGGINIYKKIKGIGIPFRRFSGRSENLYKVQPTTLWAFNLYEVTAHIVKSESRISFRQYNTGKGDSTEGSMVKELSKAKR